MRQTPILCTLGSFAATALLLSPASAQSTTRVSVDSYGNETNLHCHSPSISADGRFVAFESSAGNLVPGDTNGASDIFVHDRLTGKTRRASVDSNGVEGNGDSKWPSISANGHYVTFDSVATNLVLLDSQGYRDVFIHNLQTGITLRVSVNASRLPGNGDSRIPSISGNGRYVAYESYASNLVNGDTLGRRDIFVYDVSTMLTARVSVNSLGQQSNTDCSFPDLSADGELISFVSAAGNLVVGDSNSLDDVFIHERQTGLTTRASLNSAGGEGNGPSGKASLSAHGRYVTFESHATNLVGNDTNLQSDIFIHDLQSGMTRRISLDAGGGQTDGANYHPSLSSDGHFVAFYSHATNLVAGDTNAAADVFIKDLQSNQIIRVSRSTGGAEGNGNSDFPSISSDGSSVAFASLATNLVPRDANGKYDVFVFERAGDGPVIAKSGSCPGGVSFTLANATPNGRVAFVRGPAGQFVKPGAPCHGVRLSVSPPTLLGTMSADATGTAVLNVNLPAGACGQSVQGLDVSSCKATNVIVL